MYLKWNIYYVDVILILIMYFVKYVVVCLLGFYELFTFTIWCYVLSIVKILKIKCFTVG